MDGAGRHEAKCLDMVSNRGLWNSDLDIQCDKSKKKKALII